ncbi:methyl-accepting chemotaxis protein [Ideonella sp. YS5]|uniref:methyl-accepting chemotaxis protein n=1 Tax=Ideonella sp. YS5 TaxID=3453714 RepID=UPI003EEF7BEB
MNTLKISTRLALLIGLFALLLAASGTLGLYAASRANDSLQTVYEDRTVCLAQLAEVERRMLSNQVALHDAALASASAEAVAAGVATVEDNIAAISKVWKDYTATYLTPREAELAKTFAQERGAFAEQGLRPALQALKAGNREAAQRLMVEQVGPLFTAPARTLHQLVQLQIDVAKQENDAAVARYATMRSIAIGAIVLGVLAGSLFGAAMARGIVRQLGGEPHEVLGITRAIAAGDLGTEIRVPPNASASVVAGMAEMQQSLREIVRTVRASSESIATGSSQIATGNADLSQRTEEQASNLQQTAASMEQLSATVKHNAETAQEASRMASSASSVANRGQEVVSQVVSTMDDISQGSHRIADIIGVIDGIAFQTNILALNAAVEAARAGEQGRGFAVVAGEVRSLAQRSAQSAREIKQLIETSVDKVATGASLVADAGRTMEEVVGQVMRVNQLISDISAAGHEQTTGIGQVSNAVSQLDQVTQQNAALVEESAAASESLNQQARRLVEAVAVFKLAAA